MRTLGLAFVAVVLLLAIQCDAGITRRHYVAADEVMWDYAPNGGQQLEPVPEDAPVFLEAGVDRVGNSYKKALYRAYTDSTFSQLKSRTRDDEHLGLMGPTFYAEVGDTIEIVFRNNAAFNYTLHPHGVFYDKGSEGAKYPDGTTIGDAIAPGQTYTYVWPVPGRSGPGPGDYSSRLWLYHGHVIEERDTNAGIIGCIVVTRKGMAWPNGKPKDVDREIFLLAVIFDENSSPYIDDNIALIEEANGLSMTPRELMEDEDFAESNLLHSFNGYVYNNMPGLYMDEGDRVRWYVGGLGTEADIHTITWHGNNIVDEDGARSATAFILPAMTREFDMIPQFSGLWEVHCSVNDHSLGGMGARYTVNAKSVNPLSSSNFDSLGDPFLPESTDDDDSASLITVDSSSPASSLTAGIATALVTFVALL